MEGRRAPLRFRVSGFRGLGLRVLGGLGGLGVWGGFKV